MAETEGYVQHVGGLAAFHRERPGGARVVFVHGAMDRSASFVKAIRRLPAVDAWRYDRRGYGRSVDLGPATSLQDHVDDLLAVVDGEPAVLVGHSIGGVVALAAATKDPSVVRGVAAFESPMPWTDWWPRQSAGGLAVANAAVDGPEAAAAVFMRRMIGEEAWARLPEATRAARQAEGPALLADLGSTRGGTCPYDVEVLARAGVPVRAGHGTTSDAHHQEAARRLAAATGTEAFVIDGSGHGAHHSHPEAFARFVETVLAGR